MADGVASGETWRVFIAVDIDDHVRQALALVQAALRDTHPAIRWVPPENLHITLAFLGNLFPDQIAGLANALEITLRPLPAFSCSVAELGTFGPRHSPRVVWVGIQQGADPLIALQKTTAETIRAFGLIAEDHAFHPHLTLGRIRAARDGIALQERLDQFTGKPFGAIRVDRVLVMKSNIRPSGPVYSELYRIRLTTDP